MRKLLSLFTALLFVGTMWGDATYKLTAVTSVSAGNKYVFERDSRVLIATVTSSKLQTTDTYNTTGLTGDEDYVWTLEEATNGFYISDGEKYLNNTSSASISLGNNHSSIWTIEFTDNVALISNSSNSNRFIGETSANSHEYKAYAVGGNYGHDFTVYVLEDESSCTTEVTITKGTPANGDFDLSAESVCADGDGGTITVSNIEAAAGYRFKTITTSASGNVDNANKKVTGITAATTINVEFEAIPSHKIHFNTNSVAEIADQTVLEGAIFTITDAINEAVSDELGENCTYNTFVGWTLSSSIASASVKPALVTSVTMSTSDVTLYAVYSKTTGSGDIDDSKTFTFSDIASANDWENSQAYTTVEIDPVTIEAKGGGNNGKWYTSGGGSWRMYSGGTVEITVEGGEVTSVTSSPSCDFDIDNGVATFSPSARTDFTEITVEYTISGGGTTTYSLDAQCAEAGTCVTPSIAPGTGYYNAEQSVTITCATDGATIYYTTDGSDPVPSEADQSGKATKTYISAIAVNQSMTIKAIAIKDGMEDSEIAEAQYTLKCAMPSISGKAADIIAENYFDADALEVTLSTTTAGATIYYTTDGSTPDNTKTAYTEPFSIDDTKTIKAIAIRSGWTSSEVAEQEYIKFAVTNCATARIAALSVENSNDIYKTNAVFTIRGYVTSIPTAYDANNGYMTFWMADATNGGNVLEAYKTVLKEGTSDIPVVGDAVEVTGNLTKYVGKSSTTPEFAEGCTFEKLADGIATALDNTGDEIKAVKVLRDGQIYILRDGKEYNVMGIMVK